MSKRLRQVVFGVVSLAVAVVLVAAGIPALAGAGWDGILEQFNHLTGWELVMLGAIWLVSLYAYTFVLTASLPGLTHAQALTLNGVGSAVSNVLPFGGALGVAVTFTLARSWGHRAQAIAVSALTTGIWNVLARLSLPTFGLAALLIGGDLPDARLTFAAAVAFVACAVIVAATVAVLARESIAARLGRLIDRMVRPLPARFRPAPGWAEQGLRNLRTGTVDRVRSKWGQLTLGMVGHLGMQGVLFVACLLVTGGYPGLSKTIAAFAVSRVLTTVVVTPGGVGISETGTLALLIALGAPAAPSAAGVLLFALFAFTAEIPVGVLGWGVWTVMRRWRREPPPQEPASDGHGLTAAGHSGG
ncbi:UPF0104 family protein [Solihabitans fulvus]|uniref:UPF0104 family protein n=1 Tax=Solihabitans fulvus TaxID=1892852 RepID=A0A5B2XRZ0_9PSEU|nr:lysylphosphatidylglycerol synthase domain-containing protein [Solihabitans fulvus]KAA2266457.1 UPF0104 family protein [Solihabitans fulvus]